MNTNSFNYGYRYGLYRYCVFVCGMDGSGVDIDLSWQRYGGVCVCVCVCVCVVQRRDRYSRCCCGDWNMYGSSNSSLVDVYWSGIEFGRFLVVVPSVGPIVWIMIFGTRAWIGLCFVRFSFGLLFVALFNAFLRDSS